MKRVEMPELAWLAEHEAELEKQHPGKWIAVSPKGLVAMGDSSTEVIEEAARKGVADPLITALKSKEVQGTIIIR